MPFALTDFEADVWAWLGTQNQTAAAHLSRIDACLVVTWNVQRFAVHLVSDGTSGQAPAGELLHVRLHCDCWQKHRDIVQSRILALLGQSKRIHGRKTQVRRIDKATADFFLETNHLQGSVLGKVRYGLFLQDDLVAVASFSGARKCVRGGQVYRSFELLRFANKCHHTVVGGLDKLIQHFITNHQPDDLMTYADRDWSDGRGYRKIGFVGSEITDPQYFWLEVSTQTRHYPHRLPLQIPEQYHLNGAEVALFLNQNGFRKVWNNGNIKFLLLLK